MGVRKGIGVIAFAFGQTENQSATGPSNQAIAQVAKRICEMERKQVNITAQWETSAPLTTLGVDHYQVSHFEQETHYVSTKEALDASLKYFRQQGVDEVIFVAHPFHLKIIRLLIDIGVWKLPGFTVNRRYDLLMRGISYDQSSENIQWWTRGPLVFVTYLVKSLLTRRHGS